MENNLESYELSYNADNKTKSKKNRRKIIETFKNTFLQKKWCTGFFEPFTINEEAFLPKWKKFALRAFF